MQILGLNVCFFLALVRPATTQPWQQFDIIDDKRVPSTYQQTLATSAQMCWFLCSGDNSCQSVSYRETKQLCRLSTLTKEDLRLTIEDDGKWTTIVKTDPSEWILVFQGVADIGKDIYEAWLNGVDVTTHDVNCMGTDVTLCSNHYRNTMVDSWSSLGVRKVKLSVYDGGDEVAYITFNGTGSDLASWFDTTRVIASTWTTDLRDISANFFSLAGSTSLKRRFYINEMFSGCGGDPTVLMIKTEAGTGDTCSYDFQPTYPRIFYTTTGNWMQPANTDYAFADSMTISVQL